MFFKGNNISTVLASAVAVFLFLRLGLLSFLCRDGSHRHRQRHHRTANPQGVALAFFLKQKNRDLVSLPVLAGFCLLGDRLKHLDCQLVKAADKYDAPLVSRSDY